MRKLILFAALAASIFCHGEEENSVDWWFTPQSWVDSDKIEVYLSNAKGESVGSIEVLYGHTVDNIAKAIEDKLDEKETASQAYALATKALAQAIYSRLENKRQDEKILTLAKSLDVAILGDNYEYIDPNGNPLMGFKRTASYSEIKDSIISGRQFVTGSKPDNEDHPIEIQLKNNVLDRNMLEYVATPECKEDEKLWTLKGFYDNKLGNLWTDMQDNKYYAIPMFEGNNGQYTGSLKWYLFNGYDTSSFYTETDESSPMCNKLAFRGWHTSTLEKNLTTLLTSKDDADRTYAADLCVLVRKKTGEGDNITHTLEYVKFGDAVDTSAVPPDEGSIQTYISNDETKTNLTLYGFNDNIPNESKDGAKIPYVSADSRQDGGDPVLLWGGMENFVSETVFKKSETSGKLILNGTSEKGKFSVLAIQTGEDGEPEQTLATFSGDGISIDFGYTPDGGTFQQRAQLHNFDDPTRNGASTANDFADILTNKTVETDGWYVPLRTDAGLQYAPLKKITGITNALDSVSVGLDCEPDEYQLDHFPLYTNIVDGVVKFGLQNWDTLDNVNGVYGNDEDGPVMWRMDDSLSLECDTLHDTIEIANFTAAANRAIPFKNTTREEGTTINWLAPPSDNEGSKYLKLTGAGENATLSWDNAPSGGILPVKGNDKGNDGSSAICTNTLKFASADTTYSVSDEGGGNIKVTSQLNGINSASTGKCPFKTNGNSLQWEYPVKVNGYGPVRNINFESGSDSNVRIDTYVSGDTATITIDVYYNN